MYAYINIGWKPDRKFSSAGLSGFWSRFLEFIDKAFELK